MLPPKHAARGQEDVGLVPCELRGGAAQPRSSSSTARGSPGQPRPLPLPRPGIPQHTRGTDHSSPARNFCAVEWTAPAEDGAGGVLSQTQAGASRGDVDAQLPGGYARMHTRVAASRPLLQAPCRLPPQVIPRWTSASPRAVLGLLCFAAFGNPAFKIPPKDDCNSDSLSSALSGSSTQRPPGTPSHLCE